MVQTHIGPSKILIGIQLPLVSALFIQKLLQAIKRGTLVDLNVRLGIVNPYVGRPFLGPSMSGEREVCAIAYERSGRLISHGGCGLEGLCITQSGAIDHSVHIALERALTWSGRVVEPGRIFECVDPGDHVHEGLGSEGIIQSHLRLVSKHEEHVLRRGAYALFSRLGELDE